MKRLEGECYIVIKVYKFTAFEVFVFFVLSYNCDAIVSALSLHVGSTDSMM